MTWNKREFLISACVAILLVIAAGALRFYKLGEWSFAIDEVATLSETRALFDPTLAPPDSQTSRLPRLVPLGYLASWAGYAGFGAEEFGSRVVPALAGTLMVGVVFVLSEMLFGRRTAIIIALLLALSPAHVFQSQINRFYSLAALVAGLTTLLGALAAQRQTVVWTVLACAGVALAVLTHTVSLVLYPALCVGLIAVRRARRVPVTRGTRLVLVVTGVALLALFLLYLWPLLQGWNQAAPWGYSVGHAVLASINLLGWPVSLLAGLGLVLMFTAGDAQRWYWLCALAAWAAVTVAAPLVVSYHAWYAFPLALPGLVLAGYAVSDIYSRIRPQGAFAATIWVVVAVGLNLPSLASHFVDGSRTDMRAAARYVSEHWQAGDRVATVRLETFRYYAGHLEPAFALPPGGEAVAPLERLADGNGRLWIVLERTRAGLPDALERWLFEHAAHRLRVSRRRFDYYENAVEVFLRERRINKQSD